MITLRPHQVGAIADVDKHLSPAVRRILCVLPTGSGKSLCLAEYARRAHRLGQVCVIFAHRDVLISQLSEALCKTGVPHTFICSDKARRDITNNNLEQFGDSYWEETSTVVVSSIPTFNARLKGGKLSPQFLESVDWWLCDEAHHAIDGNQWHNSLAAMTHARGIGFTATPLRGDKKGLGSHADGLFDHLSVTVNMFDLIRTGMLSPYKIYSHGQIDIKGISRDKNGELNSKQLRIRTKEADITGDAVKHYMTHLNGKPVITFCINIEHAKEVASAFNDAGVPSVAVSSKQPMAERQAAMKAMAEGRVLNLVNVDLLGEGYDCPAVAGVIMLRRTTSYSLFKQQFGRMLRLSDGKPYGVLLDHVGNTKYMMQTYGLKYPHDDPTWTLDNTNDTKPRADDGEDDNSLETIECPACSAFGVLGTEPDPDGLNLVFVNGVCPECGHRETDEEKVARVREIKVQAGELEEQSFDLIDELLMKRDAFYQPVAEFSKHFSPYGNQMVKRAAINGHAVRQSSLDILRHWIQRWSLRQWETTGESPRMVQMTFELVFGVNILRAQGSYTASQMDKLTTSIQQHMREHHGYKTASN